MMHSVSCHLRKLPLPTACRMQLQRLVLQRRAVSTSTSWERGLLSAAQVASFRENGFIVLKDDAVFSPAEKQTIFDEVTEVQQWPLRRGEHMHYFEQVNGKSQLCRTEHYLDFNPALNRLLGFSSRPALAAAQLLGDVSGHSLVFKERINYKLPGGGGFAPHQDSPAWSGDDPTADDAELAFMRHTLNMNFAVDRMFLENGGLEVVPLPRVTGTSELFGGSFGMGEKSPRYPQNADGTLCDAFCEAQTWEPVVLEPGDVLFFSLHIAHRSGRNLTNGSRRAVYITYAGASHMAPEERTKYYEKYRRDFPPAGEHMVDSDYDKGHQIYNWATPMSAKQPHAMP